MSRYRLLKDSQVQSLAVTLEVADGIPICQAIRVRIKPQIPVAITMDGS